MREQYKDTKNQSISRTGRYTISKSDRSILTGRKRCRTDQGRLVKIQPKLVIFGAGHVAIQLLQIAKVLDFYTIMIDDREEFADPEKLPQADEVYCRDFHVHRMILLPEQ